MTHNVTPRVERLFLDTFERIEKRLAKWTPEEHHQWCSVICASRWSIGLVQSWERQFGAKLAAEEDAADQRAKNSRRSRKADSARNAPIEADLKKRAKLLANLESLRANMAPKTKRSAAKHKADKHSLAAIARRHNVKVSVVEGILRRMKEGMRI